MSPATVTAGTFLILTALGCAATPPPVASPVQTLERYVRALEAQDYASAASLLADDGRFGPDMAAVEERLRDTGPALLDEARALLAAARRPGAMIIEEVVDLPGGREVRTRR